MLKQTKNNEIELSSTEDKLGGFFNSTANLFYLFLKSYFKTLAPFINNFFLPLIITFSIIAFFPITEGFVWIIFISLAFSCFASYGVLYFNFRNSNAYKNLELTNVTVTSIYFSILLIMFLVSMLTLIVDLFLIEVFLQLNFVVALWGFQKHSRDWTFEFNLMHIQWSILFYYWLNMVVVTFAMSFVIQEITQTQKAFFLIIFIFIFSSILLGGILSPTVYIDDNNEFQVMSVAKLESMDPSEQAGYIRAYVWGGRGWYLSQLFPTYGMNQIMFGGFNSAITAFDLSSGEKIIDSPFEAWKQNDIVKMIFHPNNLKITYYLVSSWIWSLFSLWLGGTLSIRKNTK